MARSLQHQIQFYFDYWRPVLGLEGWMIHLDFSEKKLKGYAITSPSYLEAKLGFNLKRIRKELKGVKAHFGASALEELVLHEMVHVLNPRSSERQVSQTTYSLLRARALLAKSA